MGGSVDAQTPYDYAVHHTSSVTCFARVAILGDHDANLSRNEQLGCSRFSWMSGAHALSAVVPRLAPWTFPTCQTKIGAP